MTIDAALAKLHTKPFAVPSSHTALVITTTHPIHPDVLKKWVEIVGIMESQRVDAVCRIHNGPKESMDLIDTLMDALPRASTSSVAVGNDMPTSTIINTVVEAYPIPPNVTKALAALVDTLQASGRRHCVHFRPGTMEEMDAMMKDFGVPPATPMTSDSPSVMSQTNVT